MARRVGAPYPALMAALVLAGPTPAPGQLVQDAAPAPIGAQEPPVRPPLAGGFGMFVPPLRIAALGPDGRLAGPWHEIAPAAPRNHCAPNLCFDCFEPGDSGNPTGGIACGLPSDDWRWFFTQTYSNTLVMNDMTVGCGFEGSLAQRLQFGWYWFVGGAGTSERCLVAVRTAETFDASCTGPAADGFYTGVIIDFGVLVSGYQTPECCYYWSDVDLCGTGLSVQMPLDGSGAYSVTIAKAHDQATGTFTPATAAQPTLWGTEPGRPGMQGPVQWDDDNPRDGAHTPPECYDYTYGLCPDPLGAMVCFYTDAPPGSLAITQDPSCQIAPPQGAAAFTVMVSSSAPPAFRWRRDGVDLFDDGRIAGAATATLTIDPVLPSDGALYDVVVSSACGSVVSAPAGLAVCQAAKADYNGDCFVDGIDYDLFNNDFESFDPAQQINADYNGDGFVDGIDYDAFNNDFEAGC